MGAKMSQQCAQGAKKKMTSFEIDPGPHAMPKQVFLAHLEVVAARFGPPKIPKCHGSKMCFSKNDPRPFGVHKQVK